MCIRDRCGVGVAFLGFKVFAESNIYGLSYLWFKTHLCKWLSKQKTVLFWRDLTKILKKSGLATVPFYEACNPFLCIPGHYTFTANKQNPEQHHTPQQLSTTHLSSSSYMSAGIQLPTWLSFHPDYMLNVHKHTGDLDICHIYKISVNRNSQLHGTAHRWEADSVESSSKVWTCLTNGRFPLAKTASMGRTSGWLALSS